MKPSLALLIAGTLLLSACNRPESAPPPVTPVDPAATAPAAPVPGQALDLQKVPGTLQGGADQLAALTNPNNANIDPDLKVLIALLGNRISLPTQTGGLGALVQNFGGRGGIGAQGLDALQERLPTGTVTYAADGTHSRVSTPTDGYVEIDQRSKTRIEVNWKVGGAATVFVNSGYRYDAQTGQKRPVQQEVPTDATARLLADGKPVAALTFKMTPGDCLNSAGPTALTLNGWAGRDVDAPASVGLNYAWTDQAVSLSASALYRTAAQQVSAALELNVAGTTTNRCNDNFTFTPTRADLTGTLDIPGYRTDLAVYLRDLSNLKINAEAMRAHNPFAKIGGSVNAGLKFNGQPAMAAFGPLADGADMDLQPGDQVKVQYVKNGALVTTDLDGAVRDIQEALRIRD